MNRLRDLREDKDITQKELAKRFNIDQSNYSKYELEKIEIPLKLLKDLAIFYNTSTDYILGITNEIKPYPRKN
ncbi:MAG: helix-turn-helix transcriptional regulator [Bacilli bacterium]|nr:helix-turn-helix transcriptional regulator [Bacilli bacterium]